MQNSSKVTKSQLKTIVKECLLEILKEGLGNSLLRTEQETTVPKNIPERATKRSPSSSLMTAIKAEARGNPIMAEIFADTAANSLPKMLSERSGNPSSDEEQFHGNPEDVFGDDVASKWANLAFSASPKNKK
jgi:hypothetical protein